MPEQKAVVYLDDDTDLIYACNTCQTHIAHHSDIISKAFQGRSGKGYLIDKVVNVSLGPKEDRVLITGLHTVADIRCAVCATNMGWKYVYAFEKGQRYKEGKFIVEFESITKIHPDFKDG
ncbi:hypothetical protein DSO57_1001369 [Entomophthora muscae]|uniref:Uncharacterized protein n=2 Tax=Entomophthora muscae TaxID=34485 RepID=A0ACC2RV99_9FUNG|nr:hypothetical protein DSO57_1018752 [Entomophthora muscae]KAJ9067259.1 hypothetical protein DSO57_1001369 [Entomophthora muscae]